MRACIEVAGAVHAECMCYRVECDVKQQRFARARQGFGGESHLRVHSNIQPFARTWRRCEVSVCLALMHGTHLIFGVFVNVRASGGYV